MENIIFILDDDKATCDVLSSIIKHNLNNCIIYKFNDSSEMLSHQELHQVDLFIVDVSLVGETGCQVMSKVVELINRSTACLFISGRDYELKDFEDDRYTFDFINKPPNTKILINRIRVLLQVTTKYKNLEYDKMRVQLSLFDLMNHSNFYVIILDTDCNIKLCSSVLAKDLGFNNSNELIGMSWLKIIPCEIQENIVNIFDNILEKVDIVDDFREVTNPIISRNGKKIIVKWFNTKIKNGNIYSFSIGIPINKPVIDEDNINAIRSYWSDIIEVDRTTIESLKNILKNDPQQRKDNTCLET